MNNKYSENNQNSESHLPGNKFPASESKLILYNDDVNEFSYVIKCLIEILDYNEQQAEQITILAHYKGSVVVKEGEPAILLQLCNLFKDKGLKSVVLQNDQK
jgi:ATP-dependent Clp protease adapter protein ClpS